MIDPFTLFAEAARGLNASAAERPIHCLIADEQDAWLTGILAPLLRQAGHEVSFGSGTSAVRPDIILSTDPAAIDGSEDIPVLTLSESVEAAATRGTVYRYDRDRIIATISELAARRAA